MAKKIKFPLIMENNVAVRNIDSLREHFSLPIIIEYKKTGKLITWLRDHYEAGLAEALEAIDNTDVEIAGKICEIFGVEFTEEMRLNLEKETARKKRIALLKAYTDNEDFINVIDNIAFNQDELFSLLDNGLSEIYLCGEIFSIPLSQIGITYVGIGKPIVTIDSEVEVDWQEKKIVLKDIVFDEKYQKIIELAEKTNKELSEQQSHTTSASGAFGYGIKLISSTKPASKMTSNMLNSTSGAFGYGIKLISSTKPASKMTSNILNSTSGAFGYGIKLVSSTKPASKMTSNMLNSTSGAFGYGIKLISSTKPASKMTSNMMNSTSGSSGYGIKTIEKKPTKKKTAKRGAWF